MENEEGFPNISTTTPKMKPIFRQLIKIDTKIKPVQQKSTGFKKFDCKKKLTGLKNV